MHHIIDVIPPWTNPNAPSTVPRKKFHTRITTSSVESRVSRKAPFAPRVKASAKILDQPKVVNGKVYTMVEYNSLEDPHLTDFYARKLGVIPKLTDKKKKVYIYNILHTSSLENYYFLSFRLIKRITMIMV